MQSIIFSFQSILKDIFLKCLVLKTARKKNHIIMGWQMERTSGGHLLQPPLLKQLPRMKCSSCTATSQKLKEKKKQEGAQTLLTHNRLTFLQVQQQQTHGQVRIKQEFTMLFTKRKKSKHSWQKKKKKKCLRSQTSHCCAEERSNIS